MTTQPLSTLLAPLPTTGPAVVVSVPEVSPAGIYMGDMSNPGTMKINETAVAFYIGGMTPHVWTTTQINSQTARYRHPIWVYGNNRGYDGGILEGTLAVMALRGLGVPTGTSVSADMESNTPTTADLEYIYGFHAAVAPTGYWTSIYGSRDTMAGYPAFGGGKWVADWTGSAHYTGLTGEWACQFEQASGDVPWDTSIVKDTSHLWDPSVSVPDLAVLVQIPSGASRMVQSVNGGKTWQ